MALIDGVISPIAKSRPALCLLDEATRRPYPAVKRTPADVVLNLLAGQDVSDTIGEILHKLVIGGLGRRLREGWATGEFIVYEAATMPDGAIPHCYLTFGCHGKWDDIRARVDAYMKADGAAPKDHIRPACPFEGLLMSVSAAHTFHISEEKIGGRFRMIFGMLVGN
jgi:hypothetical protein